MSRKKIVLISTLVVIVLVAAFLVGSLYAPYRQYGGPTGIEIPSATINDDYEKGGQIPPSTSQRMVIYNGYISLETIDTKGTLVKIRSLADYYGGYVAGSDISKDGAEITIRIPKEKFRSAFEEIEKYGEVLNEHTSSEDITEQYVDLEARLENLQRQEKRLYEILEMAKTVDEILRVEKELERVRGTIESLQGQLNYLERNVAMSVVTIYLSEPPTPLTLPGMDWEETLETALRGLFAVTKGLIILAITLLPIIVIAIPIYYIWKRKSAKGVQKSSKD